MSQQITILYEDEYLLVLDKPAGITVNASETTIHEQTVQDWTREKLKIKNEKLKVTRSVILSDSEGSLANEDYTSDAYFEQAFLDRGGIVHRLDKETSGVLVVAKNWQAFKNLQKQFKDRTVEKTYLSLVHGVLLPSVGEISIPVDRLPWNRKHFGIVPGGRPSTTFYKVKASYMLKNTSEKFSLVELTPKTGRTHQIRVHMQYLHHPIMSDFLYAGRKTSRDDRKLLSRVFLHASKISFTHPATGGRVSFESPLPEELRQFIDQRLIKI